MASKILLADDSITIQKVVNLTFADEGIDVVAVNNGDVAERRMDEVKPDLVLADIFMPGKNGYELCEAIKNSQYRNVPVVLLVGAFEPFDQAEARRVRADAHLTKPFESRTLVETVRKLISATSKPTGGPVPAMSSPDELNDDVRAGRRDSMPDDRDTGSIAARLTSPSRLDLSAMMSDAGGTARVAARTTAELSPHISDLGSEGFEVSIAGAPASETITATLIDTDEPFETMELSSSGFTAEQFSSTLGLEATEPVLDFDRSDAFELPAGAGNLSFDSGPGGVLEIDAPGAESEAQLLDAVKTDPLEVATSESSWYEQSPQLETLAEPAFDATAPGLLAVEEPLGDVLDEPVAIESTTVEHASPSDSLSLDLTETETPATDAVTPTQFEFFEVPETSSPASADVEQPAKVEDASPQRAADWTTPRAGSYSTAQLDSVVMPLEVAEYLARKSAEEPAAEVVQEPSFSTPPQWSEEEAQFSAIDIEAVPVDEPEARAAAPVSPESAPYVETLIASSVTEPTNGASATSELSAAAIEEIVRRVITEMSDSVVREVAWEVVPDCVERVVDQLTRESLSRRA